MLASLKLSLPPYQSQGFAREACAKEEASESAAGFFIQHSRRIHAAFKV